MIIQLGLFLKNDAHRTKSRWDGRLKRKSHACIFLLQGVGGGVDCSKKRLPMFIYNQL